MDGGVHHNLTQVRVRYSIDSKHPGSMVKSCSITGRVELLWKNCILPEVSSSTNVYIEDHYINWLYQLKKQSREDTLFSK